ncbi:MAG: hypothetical protein K2O57_03530, partial [Acetatifactor sp.]|nr:hypothetical protein [Acetatifactor sp.]
PGLESGGAGGGPSVSARDRVTPVVVDSHGAMGSLMSGSGPTVFGIFGDRAEAEKLAGLLREMDAFCVKQCFVTEFVQ